MTRGHLTRRRVLTTAAGAALGATAPGVLGGAAAAFVPRGRPVLTHGVQSGEAVGHSALVWTRADRP